MVEHASTGGSPLPGTTALASGTYYVSQTVSGCESGRTLVNVTTTSVIPSVSITSTTTSICSGGSVTFTATPTNGGSSPTYQWMINGVNVAGQTASTFTTSSLANGNTVTVMMTSNDPCANPATATSNSITITTTSVTPSVSITASTTSICSGGSVTFTATPTNGGPGPTYQWMINGVNVAGQTASTFTSSTLANGNIVTVMMTSNDPCANPATATSNPITDHYHHCCSICIHHINHYFNMQWWLCYLYCHTNQWWINPDLSMDDQWSECGGPNSFNFYNIISCQWQYRISDDDQ